MTDDLDGLKAYIDQHLAQLGITVDRHGRLLGAVDREIPRLAAQIQQLTAPPAPPPGGPVVEWMQIEDYDRAANALLDLKIWVEAVWRWYDEKLRGCWPWHPPVVAALLAVKRAHTAAAAPGSSPLALADWHTRFQPTTAVQVGHRLKPCDDLGHRDGKNRAQVWTVDPTRLTEYALWWASTHGIGNSIPPGLTLRTDS